MYELKSCYLRCTKHGASFGLIDLISEQIMYKKFDSKKFLGRFTTDTMFKHHHQSRKVGGAVCLNVRMTTFDLDVNLISFSEVGKHVTE